MSEPLSTGLIRIYNATKKVTSLVHCKSHADNPAMHRVRALEGCDLWQSKVANDAHSLATILRYANLVRQTAPYR